MRAAFLDGDAALLDPAVAEVVEVDHFADFGEREADVLGAHDPREPRPVALRVEPREPHALRRDQPLVLVEPESARGAAELFRQVRDREGGAVVLVGPIEQGAGT